MAFERWCIVDLMGHMKFAGHVSEVEIAGTKSLRCDIYDSPDVVRSTRFFTMGSVYLLTPVSPEVAIAYMRPWEPEPERPAPAPHPTAEPSDIPF